LPRSGGWILQRQIPNTSDWDGIGCYPLFACQDWSQLPVDLDYLQTDLVTLALVTDPFGAYDPASLKEFFDLVIPFKQHFIVDLKRPIDEIISSHHRYYAQRALRQLQVDRCKNPPEFLSQWVSLYATLTEKHKLSGIKAFSKHAFAKQLNTPGTILFHASDGQEIVAACIYFVQGAVGYNHLMALSPNGYKLSASYALYWKVIEYFQGKLRWLDLGAGAGLQNKSDDGLTFFKRGWSTGTREAFFCGRILDQKKYACITAAKKISTSDFFPAYRKGEF
jgi:hypothetical protein